MDSSGVKGVMRATTDSRALYERTTEVARRHGCDRGTFSVCWGEYERGATCQCREDAKAELAEGKLGASMVHDARQILEDAAAAKKRRAEQMPTQFDVLRVMMQCHQRLCDLGWKEAIYCPKDGTIFDAIEFGSTGVHDCHYEGEWPKGSWWLHDGDDLMPSRPIMFKLKS